MIWRTVNASGVGGLLAATLNGKTHMIPFRGFDLLRCRMSGRGGDAFADLRYFRALDDLDLGLVSASEDGE